MDKIIFATILIIFPLGQIVKWQYINLFDVFVFLLAFWTILHKPKYPKWFYYLLTFFLFSLFSLIFNYQLFNLRGFLYLVRFVSYSYIAIYIYNFIKHQKSIFNNLLSVSVVSAIFGWVQYLFSPDTTFLKIYGWDDHLYRMIGTFFDPTFLGLIFVLGCILALYSKKYSIFYFLLVSLIFTYSRINYFLILLISLINKKYFAVLLVILGMIFLPKNIGEGTNLARTASGLQKIENYKETLKIIDSSPLVGVGFNNLCRAREIYLADTNTESHACNGSDSSILFLFATTGVIGLILLPYVIRRMPHGVLLKTTFVVVLVHSMFANSLFYPHIMFWLFCLVGLRGKINRNSRFA